MTSPSNWLAKFDAVVSEREIGRLTAELDAAVREREDYNGKHQAACLEIERLRALPEEIAKMIEGFTADQIRLAAGEMTAQEMRTVRAVQRWWVSAIRHKAALTANEDKP